jgi:hypothetical protein
MAQAVEGLPSKHETLGSNASTTKKKKKKVANFKKWLLKSLLHL